VALFDFGVNSSPSEAIRALQRILGVRPVRGNFKVLTMAAVVARTDQVQLAVELTEERARYLGRLVRRDPTQVANVGGWAARLVALTGLVCRLPG